MNTVIFKLHVKEELKFHLLQLNYKKMIHEFDFISDCQYQHYGIMQTQINIDKHFD